LIVNKGYRIRFSCWQCTLINDFAYDHGENNEWRGVDVNWAYNHYFEIAADLAECGIYDGIAHPDLLKLFGHKPSFSLLPHYNNLAAVLDKRKMYAEQSSGAAGTEKAHATGN